MDAKSLCLKLLTTEPVWLCDQKIYQNYAGKSDFAVFWGKKQVAQSTNITDSDA